MYRFQNFDEQKRSRHCRNLLMKQVLQSGASAQFRSSGSSLHPIVHSGDSVVFEPVLSCDNLVVGDVVFCEVQPKNFFYAERIKKIEWVGRSRLTRARQFEIGDWGYACDHNIYGRLVEVMYQG